MAEQRRAETRPSGRARRPASSKGPEAAARSACRGLESLINHPSEGASAVRRTEDGWCVAVDVLEVARIPDTTSLLATYEVLIGEDGELREYHRVRRYRRGAADE